MESYGKILLIAMPIFLGLVLIEKLYGYWKNNDQTPAMDAISSLSSGITNVVKDVLGLSASVISYAWMYEHLAIFQLEAGILTYIIGFFVIDFYGYWTHRWAHQINFFWNKHAIHHSSEEFNLACALRQSVSSWVNLFTLLLLPAAIIGVPTQVIAIAIPIHLFAQFWYHTQHIGKMGFLEKIIVTPSHHRVHHAINPVYMDRNHGQILIIWDKLFNTFQEELKDIPPVYGITRPALTWNPIKINYQHLWILIQDAWRAKHLKDKFRIWFMPTGWRPSDVEEQFPITKIENEYDFVKYNSTTSPKMIFWAVCQLLFTFTFVSYFFANIGNINSPQIFIYGLFVFLTVYSYSELMDQKKYSLMWETFRLAFGLSLINYYGDWFGLSSFLSWGNELVISCLVFSWLINFYFVYFEFKISENLIYSKIS